MKEFCILWTWWFWQTYLKQCGITFNNNFTQLFIISRYTSLLVYSCKWRIFVFCDQICFQLDYVKVSHLILYLFPFDIFSSPGQRPCELLPSLGGRRPSVRRKLSHLNLLLWHRWTKLYLTWKGWSLGGSLSKLCPKVPPSIPDGCCY